MTVQEAIKKFKTGGFFDGKSEKAAQKRIKPGEEVLWASDSLVWFPGGNHARGTITLTNQRIFFCQDLAMGSGKDERHFPLESIIKASFRVDNNMPFLVIESLTDNMMILCKEKEARPGLEILEQMLAQKRKDQKAEFAEIAKGETKSGAQELREWKALLDEGIITQAEFDAKKKQVLGL